MEAAGRGRLGGEKLGEQGGAGGVLVPLIVHLLARAYGGLGIAVGLFASNIPTGLPWATCIYLHKRKQWHSNGNVESTS
jgi:hypothetical protein